MALAAHGHNVAGLAEASRLKAVLRSAIDSVDAIALNCAGSNHSVDMILAETAPPNAPSDSHPTLPRLGMVLLAVGILAAGIGANHVREGDMAAVKKENPGPLLDGGLKAMLAKDWETACGFFLRAYYNNASADESLGRVAECYFYLGKKEEALGACSDLECKTEGISSVPPYIRGLIAFQEKDYAKARAEFKISELAGNHRALAMLKRVPQ